MNLDILRVELQFDSATAAAVAGLLSADQDGGPGARPRDEDSVKESIANAYLNAERTFIAIEFLRNIRADQFTGGKTDNLESLAREGLLQPAEARELAREFQDLFAFLDPDGLRDGDRLDYVIAGDTVRAAYVNVEGDTLQAFERIGAHQRAAMLGAYFAESSDFRDGLVETVLDCLRGSG